MWGCKRWGRFGLSVGLATVLATGSLGLAVGSPAPERRPITRCSNGLLALTFDDGPSRTVTPRLLDLLVEKEVPATFFVVGARAAASPRIVERIDDLGFDLANHSYRHEQLTRLGSDAIRASLRRTRAAVTDAGAEMTRLMRPPYGLINARVDSVVTGMGLTPVLWSVDPEDWEGAASGTIADRVINGLRPHRPNVVLLHDGVANSPSTLRALPEIIRRARLRGYCFAKLGSGGRPVPPVPVAHVHRGGILSEGTGESRRLRFAVSLDRPTSQPTSVWIHSEDGSARAGEDYAGVAKRLFFPVGTTRRSVAVRVFGDSRDEKRERLVLTVGGPRGVAIADENASGWIRDDDEPPEVSLGDIAVLEPVSGSSLAQVPVTLSRSSGRWVSVTVTTSPGTATAEDFAATQTAVLIAPGDLSTTVPIPVLADDVDEEAEEFSVHIESATKAIVADDAALVTINQPLSLFLVRQLPLP